MARLPSIPASSIWSARFERQRRLLIIWGLVLVVVVAALIWSPYFRGLYNISNLIKQSGALLLASIGQTVVLLTAGIDLSVGSIISMTVTFLARFVAPNPVSIITGVLLVLCVGSLVGLINGLVISRLKINPFMATLASLSIVQGVAYILGTNPRSILPREFSPIFTGNIGPLPIPVLLLGITTTSVAVLLRHTAFGRHIYAIGSNERSSRLSGIPTDRIKVAVYALSAFMATLAGIFIAARSRAGDPLIGTSFAFDSITATVLGGVSLFGGRGSILGTLGGVLIISILSNLMNIHGVSSNYQYVLRGALLIIATMLYSRKD